MLGNDDEEVVGHLELLDELDEVMLEQVRGVELGASEPDVLSDDVSAPTLAELAIVGQQDRRVLGGIDGQGVV